MPFLGTQNFSQRPIVQHTRVASISAVRRAYTDVVCRLVNADDDKAYAAFIDGVSLCELMPLDTGWMQVDSSRGVMVGLNQHEI